MCAYRWYMQVCTYVRTWYVCTHTYIHTCSDAFKTDSTCYDYTIFRFLSRLLKEAFVQCEVPVHMISRLCTTSNKNWHAMRRRDDWQQQFINLPSRSHRSAVRCAHHQHNSRATINTVVHLSSRKHQQDLISLYLEVCNIIHSLHGFVHSALQREFKRAVKQKCSKQHLLFIYNKWGNLWSEKVTWKWFN